MAHFTGGARSGRRLASSPIRRERPHGVVITHEYDGHQGKTGKREPYILLVGTCRAARKQGIATALLAKTMTAAVTTATDRRRWK